MVEELIKIREELLVGVENNDLLYIKMHINRLDTLIYDANNMATTNGWVKVYDKTPPDDVELLAKAPDGNIHLTEWRPAYDIFCCQSKNEVSYDWEWKLV